MKYLPAGSIIDIGGEGRHPRAWNVNPSRTITLGKNAGKSIPRLIVARADALPFPTDGVSDIIVERTPLSRAALWEISRVIAPGGRVVIRHVPFPDRDRHRAAIEILAGNVNRTTTTIHGQRTIETTIVVQGPTGDH